MKRPGRPMSSVWVATDQAAAELGITPRQLRKLRSQMKPGHHYRVKNARAARPEYLWHPERIQVLLIPESIPNNNLSF